MPNFYSNFIARKSHTGYIVFNEELPASLCRSLIQLLNEEAFLFPGSNT